MASKIGLTYILDEDLNPVLEDDPHTWGLWMNDPHTNRIVSNTFVTKDIYISTVFTGIDHSNSFGAFVTNPVLYESMVFGGELHLEQERYISRLEAIKGHEIMVNKVLESLDAKVD